MPAFRAGRLARVVGTIAVALLLASAALPASAAPTNAAIRAKQAEAARIQDQLDEMNADLEEQVEEYDAVTETLDDTRLKIAETEAEMARAEADLAAARGVLARRVSGIYRRGPVDPIGMLLGTSSFQDFLNRLDLLRRVSRRDAEAVAAVKEARARIEAAERTLEARESELIVLRDKAKLKKESIERRVAERARYLAAVNADVKRLIDVERKRQAEAAAEAARRAARNGGMFFDPSKLKGGHPEVVAVAQRYLGVPYVWGGTSPSGFDCSGLMWYCYREIGIDLPRTSRSQFRAGQYVPPDRLDLLLPGDLVFFGRDGDPDRVHHVGMYVTNGIFIHAPSTGEVVQFASLKERIADNGDYVGAARF